MLTWIICGIEGAIIIWLLFLLGQWKYFCYHNRHDRKKNTWLVFEKDGLVRYGSSYERRRFGPPRQVNTRVIEKPRIDDGESNNYLSTNE